MTTEPLPLDWGTTEQLKRVMNEPRKERDMTRTEYIEAALLYCLATYVPVGNLTRKIDDLEATGEDQQLCVTVRDGLVHFTPIDVDLDVDDATDPIIGDVTNVPSA